MFRTKGIYVAPRRVLATFLRFNDTNDAEMGEVMVSSALLATATREGDEKLGIEAYLSPYGGIRWPQHEEKQHADVVMLIQTRAKRCP